MEFNKDWPLIVLALAALIVAFNSGRYMEQTTRTVHLRTSCDVDRVDHLKAGWYTEVR